MLRAIAVVIASDCSLFFLSRYLVSPLARVLECSTPSSTRLLFYYFTIHYFTLIKTP